MDISSEDQLALGRKGQGRRAVVVSAGGETNKKIPWITARLASLAFCVGGNKKSVGGPQHGQQWINSSWGLG